MRFDRNFNQVDKYDEDKDKKLSSKEERQFRDDMKAIFEAANKQILLDYDSNKNRRLDKAELVVIREKIPNFLQYALTLEERKAEEVAKKKEEEERERNRKVSIFELYN